MSDHEVHDDDDAAAPHRFRATLVRVMLVQVVTLIVLWLVQHHFNTP